MAQYAVLTCTNTMKFVEWGREAYELWAPIQRDAVFNKKTGVHDHKSTAALPGYCFVPARKALACQYMAPPKFYCAFLGYDSYGTPLAVRSEVLFDMQTMLNDEASAQAKPGSRWAPRVGDRVAFRVPPLAGMVATVEYVRTGSVRVLVGTKFITTSPVFLQPV